MAADGGGDLWLLMTVAGVAILGLAIAFAMISNRRHMTRQKRQLAEQATKDVYAAEARDPANRS